MRHHQIMAIAIDQRSKHVPDVQSILTEYGCIIKVRLGLHETDDKCSEDGLLLLHLDDTEGKHKEMEKALNHLDGVRASTMIL